MFSVPSVSLCAVVSQYVLQCLRVCAYVPYVSGVYVIQGTSVMSMCMNVIQGIMFYVYVCTFTVRVHFLSLLFGGVNILCVCSDGKNVLCVTSSV